MSNAKKSRRALIVTGEASGDLHGGNLIRAAREVDPDLSFFGIGGSRMAEAGCEILIPGESISVMGLVEVVGHFPVIWRAFRRMKQILQGAQRPDLLILIDFPEFNLRLARVAKAAGVPVLFYVSPQIWAWRQGRVRKIAQVVDKLAVIFPFEEAFYRGHQIDVEYVGNPLLDEVEVQIGREPYLRRLGLDPGRAVVGLFPGSRRNEIRYILETILQTAQQLAVALPGVQFLLPVASSLPAEMFEAPLAEKKLPVTLVDDRIYDVANACDAVLCVSGTVTLQTALVETPMAVVYQMSPLTYAIGRRLVKVPHISLANIVAGAPVVREFIQEQATPEALCAEILRLLHDPEYNRQVRAGLGTIRRRMGEKGCSQRVAAIASALSQKTLGQADQ
ncbi:MAG: lipid-A-disaccharide synthase [Desulfuromonadales bacterium]|nr:lipid-A-disaccharide synthase [Desulfuromonadales bacterium]